jgi:hypothetical protein
MPNDMDLTILGFRVSTRQIADWRYVPSLGVPLLASSEQAIAPAIYWASHALRNDDVFADYVFIVIINAPSVPFCTILWREIRIIPSVVT